MSSQVQDVEKVKLQHENEIPKKLEIICNLSRCLYIIPVKEVESKVFEYLLPAMKNVLSQVFQEISDILATGDTEKSLQTLTILEQYLKICTTLLESGDVILDYIIQNVSTELKYIQSVPLNLIKMILAIFQHCRESNKLYHVYLEELCEIVTLFKKAKALHFKLLPVLDMHVVMNLESNDEIFLLQEVLEKIADIGAVLAGINVTSMAESWKAYIALTQKHVDVLNKHSFNIRQPLEVLSSEILKHMTSALKTVDIQDVRVITQAVKISNFLVKVAIKLCEMFWKHLEKCSKHILSLLCSIYSFDTQYLRTKGYSKNILDLLNRNIFEHSGAFLNQLILDCKFCKVFSHDELINEIVLEKNVGLLLLIVSIIQKIKTDPNIRTVLCLHKLLKVTCTAVKDGYSHFQLEQPIIYERLLVNFVSCILLCNQEQYNHIEHILLTNVMQQEVWSSLLATDIWCLLLRHTPADLSYETICNIIDSLEPTLRACVTLAPEMVHIESFIQRVYVALPDDLKVALILKYPVPTKVHIWRICGCKRFPKSQKFIIQSFLICVVDKLETMKTLTGNMEDYIYLCHSLHIISTMPVDTEFNEVKCDVISLIHRLWDFDLKPEDTILETAIFKYFIAKLYLATTNTVIHFRSEQLLRVLSQIKKLLNLNFDTQFSALQILDFVSDKVIEPSVEQKHIFLIISEICNSLLQSSNPIIRQRSLEVVSTFYYSTSHKEVVQAMVKNDKNLQQLVSNYLQKQIVARTSISAEDYYNQQKTYQFKHQCSRFAPESVPVLKKLKADSDDIQLTLQKITVDVESLTKLCQNRKCPENIVAQVCDVINSLQLLI